MCQSVLGKIERLSEDCPATDWLKSANHQGRILFFSLSMKGLTTSLQSLVFLDEDIRFLRPDVQVWLGFRFCSDRKKARLGRIELELSSNASDWDKMGFAAVDLSCILLLLLYVAGSTQAISWSDFG